MNRSRLQKGRYAVALVKLSPGITSITGRFGGVYFKKDNSGQHVQAMPRVIHYTRTPAQMSSQQAYTVLSIIVVAMILAGWLAVWVAYAASHWWKNRHGDVVKLTWWQWYLHYNIPRIMLGLPAWSEPPKD